MSTTYRTIVRVPEQSSHGINIAPLLPLLFWAAVILGIYIWVRRRRIRKRQREVQIKAINNNQDTVIEDKPSIRPVESRVATSGIFLCYRRSDSADSAGRIYDRLVEQYGKNSVFKDVDSIPLGVDFRSAIAATITRCNVFLAVIGPDWRDRTKSGDRLEDPRDHVRIEIESALHRKIPLIPILVRGATMPAEKDLPEKLGDLAYRNGISVRVDPDFHQDVTRLIAGVDEHLKRPSH